MHEHDQGHFQYNLSFQASREFHIGGTVANLVYHLGTSDS